VATIHEKTRTASTWGCVNSGIKAGICSILSRFLLFDDKNPMG
jgi:hypothetical protein